MEADSSSDVIGRDASVDVDIAIEETERWFVRQGLPHFIADYTATENVLPRAIPVLTLSFLVSAVTTINRNWPLWRNVGAVIVSFLVLVAIWAVSNRARGLPALRKPETVGSVEVGLFIFGPAVLNLLLRDPRAAGVTVLVNVVQLVVIYYATSYGLAPLAYWNLRRVVDRLDLAFRLAGRTFPLLLLAMTFLLLNSTAWRTITRTPLSNYLLLLCFFGGVTLLFAYQMIESEYDEVSTFETPDEIYDLSVDSPAARTPSLPLTQPFSPPLTRRERTNVVLLAMLAVLEYVTVVTLAMLLFFVFFGLFTIPADVVSSLVGRPTEPLVTITLFNAPISLTRELVRISGFVAVFSGLYLTVHAYTDRTFRQDLDGSVKTQLRKAFAVRAVYRTMITRESR